MTNDPETMRVHHRFAAETIPNIRALCEAIEVCPAIMQDQKCRTDIGHALNATVAGQSAIRKLPVALQVEFAEVIARLLVAIGCNAAPAAASCP